jgi:hypothetical protein
MRAALVWLAVATSVASAAPKDPPKDPPKAEPAKPPPGPDDAKATAILDKIASGNAATRKAEIEKLNALAPSVIDGLGTYLARPHQAAIEARRKVLEAIKASVPDKTGKFTQPQRQKASDEQADEKFDWMQPLLELDPNAVPAPTRSNDKPQPLDAVAIGEVIADDAALRALASTRDVHAAEVIFDAAFGADTMIYRDECGRYIRKMEPVSIPALIREADNKDYDRRRYATYQLERLDRQEPLNALNAATDSEALTIAILEAFRATHAREAVHAVWTRVGDPSPRIRAAARAAWMDYITGPPPPPAPRRKLQLPGGKLTKKPKPLWLTYRELADNELRKAANELLHEDYPLDDPSVDDIERTSKTVKVDLLELTKRLFAYLDDERGKKEAAEWTAAKVKADTGDLAGATTMLDRLLAANPDRSEHAAMAQIYFKWAQQLDGKQQWADASAAYSKAHGLDPKGPLATEALAAHHYTLGKTLEAQGKDGGPDFRRAIALQPSYAQARNAAAAATAFLACA